MIEPYYEHKGITIYHGDCREVLPQLEPVDLVLTDPPYGKVRGDFDNAWANRPAMLESCEEWINAIVPRMKANATLYWFAWPSLAGRIEAAIAKRLNLLGHIIWKKPTSLANKACPEALRSPMPETERIIMAEHYGADNWALGETGYGAKCDEARGMVFEPLRAYLDGERRKAGVSTKECNLACGNQMAGHYFTRSQWALPTEENYNRLRALFNASDGDHLRREYDDLRREYDDLRREYDDLRTEFNGLRRFFELLPGDPKTDVWEFPSESHRFDHPTVKPLRLIKFMARVSCRKGGLILDPFMGSGTTLRAAKDLGRKAIGIELEEKYCEIAAKRLQQEVFGFGEVKP